MKGGLLNRSMVVQVALQTAEEHGLRGLTLSLVADRLGVDAASVRRVFPDRQQLADAVVAGVLHDAHTNAHTGIDTEGETAADWAPARSWQGYLQTVAHALRRAAMKDPSVVVWIAASAPSAPWLSPPVRDVAFVEQLLTTLLGYGMNDHQAVLTYRAFVRFLNGWLLLEASATPVGLVGARPGWASDGAPTINEHSILLRLRPLLEDDRSRDEFEAALESLLDRLERDLSGLDLHSL